MSTYDLRTNREEKVCEQILELNEWLIVINPTHIQDKQVLESKVYVYLKFNSYSSSEIFNRNMAPERKQLYKKAKHVKTPSCLFFCCLAHKEF